VRRDDRAREPAELGVEGEELKAVGGGETTEEVEHGPG